MVHPERIIMASKTVKRQIKKNDNSVLIFWLMIIAFLVFILNVWMISDVAEEFEKYSKKYESITEK